MTGRAMTDDERAQERDLETESLGEVEAGFLQGPHSEGDISGIVGSDDWSLSKRFALYQGEEKNSNH